MTRTQHLKSIGLMCIKDIAALLNTYPDKVSYMVKELELVPIDYIWYDEHQIQLIKEFRTTRKK
jgi:hypothetical protein